jgi:hypothetical protein
MFMTLLQFQGAVKYLHGNAPNRIAFFFKQGGRHRGINAATKPNGNRCTFLIFTSGHELFCNRLGPQAGYLSSFTVYQPCFEINSSIMSQELVKKPYSGLKAFCSLRRPFWGGLQRSHWALNGVLEPLPSKYMNNHPAP